MTGLTSAVIPVSEVDPFAIDYIRNPYPFHEELRELAPMVWLRKYDVWCVPRYQEAQSVLQDWRAFCSGAGVGLANFKKEKPWRIPSLLLESDPPNHTRCRAVMGRVLSAGKIRKLRNCFEHEAANVVDQVLAKPAINGLKHIAEPYVTRVFADAVGLGPEGRENIMAYGSMNFNSLGPRNAIFRDATANESSVKDWVTLHCRRSHISAPGLAAEIYEAADRGEV